MDMKLDPDMDVNMDLDIDMDVETNDVNWTFRLDEILKLDAPEDVVTARLQELADEGCADAWFELGKRFFHDEKTAEGARCFRQAADLGDESAASIFGYCCEEGLGVPVNPELAEAYYQQSPYDSYAAFRLAALQEARATTAAEFRAAADGYACSLESVAWPEDCSGSAWLGLGRCLLQIPARHRPYNMPSPMSCFDAVSGAACTPAEYRESLYHLGRMYLFGLETRCDPDTAREYLEEAAEGSYAPAQALLQQMDAWAQVPGDILRPADEAARRAEALLRLELLEGMGVGRDIRLQCADTGLPGYAADDCRGFAVFDPDAKPEIQAAIGNLARRGLTVYFVHESVTLTYGTMAALLYVSDDPARWPTERMDLLRGTPMAAVANLTDDYMEIGGISFTIADQLMERLY